MPDAANPKDVIGSTKAGMWHVPTPVLVEIGLGMQEGAQKYGSHNWRSTPVRASIYFDATLRHLFAWKEGEDFDPDTGDAVSHITKAIASLVVLRDAMINGTFVDDRPPQTSNGDFYREANARAKALAER